MSEHSAELVSQVRHQPLSPFRAGSVPFIPSQRLLRDLRLKSPRVHRHGEKTGRNTFLVRGLGDVAHVAGPLAVVDQHRLRERDDSGKLRVSPVYRQGRAGARYGFAAFKNVIPRPATTDR